MATASDLDQPAFERLEGMVAAQCALTPEAPAIFHEGRTTSYRHLARRTSRIAGALVELGLGRGDLIGIHLERSAEMIAAILATLDVGAAYVPLSPDLPRERFEFMVADSGLCAILTDRDLFLPLWHGLVLDMRVPLAALERLLESGREKDPSDLACVFYTSGSTGKPKGVALAHTASRHIRRAQRLFGQGELSRVAATTSIAFDPSLFEIFAPLATGGTLILKESLLVPFAADEAPTLIQAVPSALVELIRLGQVPTSLRAVNIGGEVLSAALCRSLQALLPQVRLFNHYGPTEATICAAMLEVPNPCLTAPALGYPVCGARIALIDERGQRLSPGQIGEIAILGDMLALGYHGHAAGAEVGFSRDSTSGERLYRTGDRGRVNGDGALEFHGRHGDQVKLRGVRIELDEVETALRQVPGIDLTAAAVRCDAQGRDRLVAYVTHSYHGDVVSLRDTLGPVLPLAMLPSMLVRLEAFPLTATGKIDRRALPDPGAVEQKQPQGRMEERIAALFARMLGVPGLGPKADFFANGGDSLMAVEMAVQLETWAGCSVPPALIMQASTPQALAQALMREPPQGFSHLLPLRSEGEGSPVFVAADLHGRPTSMMALARHLARPVHALVPGDRLTAGDEAIDLRGLARRYVEEIRVVQPAGPYTVAGFSFGAPWALAMAAALEEAGEAARLILLDPLPCSARLPSPLLMARVGWQALSGGSLTRLVAAGRRTLSRRNLLPDFVPDSARSLALRLLAATPSFQGCRFAGPTVLVLSTQRSWRERLRDGDGMLGWSRLLTGQTKVLRCEAAHHEMMREPHVAAIGQAVASELR